MIKIYKTRGCDLLGEYEVKRIKKKLADADYFVYNYKNHGWVGSGFAIWKKNGKYGYTSLGHCSCYGAVEDLNSIMFTLPQLKKLVKKEYMDDYAPEVYARIKELEEKQ